MSSDDIRQRQPQSKEAESRFLLGDAEEEKDPFVQKSGEKRARAEGGGGAGGARDEGEAVRGGGGQGSDYWDLDDDGDWGSGDKEETPQQKNRKILRRSTAEAGTAFSIHLAIMCFYIYVHVYDATIVRRNRGKGFEGSELYGGRWKFLTYLNMWVQFGYFFLCFFTDIMPHSEAKIWFRKVCDFVFTTLAFPLAWVVVISFWGIYAVNRELIYPARLDEYIPLMLNHFWHTTVAVGVMIEILFVFHRYPSNLGGITALFIYSTAYIIWIIWVLTAANFWVYPFLEHIPPPAISVFFATSFFLSVMIYFVGKKVAYLRMGRWGERHRLMDELGL